MTSISLPFNSISKAKVTPMPPISIDTVKSKVVKKRRRASRSAKASGRAFQSELELSFEVYTKNNTSAVIELERIWDLDDFIGRSCPSCQAPLDHCHRCGFTLPRLGMMPPKRKADYYLTFKGMTIYIEAKSYRSAWGYVAKHGDRENIKSHQLESLKNHVEAGGLSYLFFCERWAPEEHVLHIVPILTWLGVMRVRSRIKWSELKGMAISSTPVQYDGEDRYYDMTGFMEHVSSETSIQRTIQAKLEGSKLIL